MKDKENINDNEAGDDLEAYIQGLSQEDAVRFKQILYDYLDDYSKKDKDKSDQQWLEERLEKDLPDKSKEEIQEISQKSVETVNQFNENYKELTEHTKSGGTKESWFVKKVEEATTGMSAAQVAGHLDILNRQLEMGNAQMFRTLTTNEGMVSLCANLDGFIAEQHHVNSFNNSAILKGSPYRAEVCVPKPGHTYGRNSFDVIIKDTRTGKRVHQYQLKYGADAKATIKYIKEGNYNNQTLIVPSEQVNEVQKAFPKKTVKAYLEAGDVKSVELTKAEAKARQIEAQKSSPTPENFWNNYNKKKLAINVGKNAGMAGVQAAAITAGLSMAQKVAKGESVDKDETIELALKTGADAGVKSAATGALKVGVEKDIIKIIPKGTPVQTIAGVACVGIEDIKICGKVANGEMTVTEGVDAIGNTTVSMTAGMQGALVGGEIGAAALCWIPVVGPAVGGLVGGMVGYAAGSKVGQTVYKGAKKIGKTVAKAAKSVVSGVKSIGSSIFSGLRSLFS